MPVLLLALLLCLAAGWCILAVVWPAASRPGDAWIRGFLTVGIGAGVCSLGYFALLLLGVQPRAAWLLGLLTALAVVLGVATRLRGATSARGIALAPAARLPGVLVGIAVLAFSASFVLATAQAPHGSADAVTIWNLRARMLCDNAVFWRQAFDADLVATGANYPMLSACVTAGIWEAVGVRSAAVPAAIAWAFAAGTVGLLWASLRALRGGHAGALAGGMMLACPLFATSAAYQYQDIPLGFYFLSALVLLARYDEGGRREAPLVLLAGAAAGLAAWTKNEGALFLVVLAGVRSWTRRGGGWRAAARELAGLALGAAPALLALIVFKLSLAPTHVLVAEAMGNETIARLCDGVRYVDILVAVWDSVWGMGWWLVALLLLWSVLCSRGRVAFPLAVVGLMVLGYCAIYLLTCKDLRWLLGTSMGRLLLQLLPSVVFAVCSGGWPANVLVAAAGLGASAQRLP